MKSSGCGALAATALAGMLMVFPLVAKAETLTDALIDAYRNSNLLDQNRAVLRAADEDVALAMTSLRPVVNFVAGAEQRMADVRGLTGARSFEPVDVSTSLRITAEVTVHDFGRSERAIDAAKETVLATRQALVGVEQRVLLTAVSAFMQVRQTSETVALRESNLELIRQELRAAQDRFEVGEITRTDVAIAESRLAAAQSDLAAAEGDLEVAREMYRVAVGRYPGDLRTPPGLPELAPSLEAAQSIARRTHPSIARAQHEVTAADLNVQRAAAATQGQITAGANAGVTVQGKSRAQSESGATRDAGVSLRFTRPIYQGGRLSAQQRQAMAQRDSTRAQLHQTTIEVLEEVGRAWSDLQVAEARIRASELQIEAAQQAFEGVSEEATLGARTTLDVLDAEQELLNARAARISAEAGRQVAAYSVLSSMGLMTADHLNLGIPTYDPVTYYEAVRDAPVSIRGERLNRVLESIGRN